MRFPLYANLLLTLPLLAACDQTSFFARNQQPQDPVLAAAAQNPSDKAVALPQEIVASAKVEHLTGEDYVISQVQLGNFPCSNNIHISVAADPANPKWFLVEGKGFSYRMKPVTTQSGAIRLEDEEGGLVWLQVATKSMLMNQKAGKRLADACVSPRQVARAQELDGAATALPVSAETATAKKKSATTAKGNASQKAATAKKSTAKTTAASKK